MTLTQPVAADRLHRAAASPPEAPAAASRRPALACAVTLVVTGGAGAALLVAANRAAEWDTGRQFGLFWLGMLVFTLPAVAWLVRRTSSARLRVAVLTAYAGFTYLPKLLRTPDGPLYHDEFAHWRQAHQILLDGRLFEQNPIVKVVGDFPGLHSTVASISALTGVSIWHGALFVLITAHLLVVLGVAVLAEEIWPDGRIAAVAAVLYSMNSSFLFFDTQFGYESLAIPLLVWTLVALHRAMRGPAGRARLGWSAVTLVLSAATIATHHLTALGLLGVMLILCAVATARALRRSHPRAVTWTAWVLTGSAAVLVVTYLAVVAPRTAGYLDPYLAKALDQVAGMAGSSGSGKRTLFRESVAPWWERYAAFGAQGLAGAAMAAALWRLRYRRTGDAVSRTGALAMLVLGSLYFPAALLILTPSGAEGARRSWAFSYLGIALVVAPVVVALLDHATRRTARAAVAVALLAACTVALVGNTAAGMNPSYRFPGPPVFGSDTRSAIPEVAAASAWLRETQGRDLRIVADRYSGLIFGSYGEQRPVTGSQSFRTYDLYLAQPGREIPPRLIEQLSSWRFGYLIVDRRMAREVPEIQIYFETNEPVPHDGRPAFTLGQLTKFDHTPWTIKIYDSGNIAIYRFDFTSYGGPR
ncbi:hypothetical protein Aab01nite_34180 [Paractinoplanes abujensis]|uniref:Glycosyltransferase RgtA/B/C/D-like domain-containing protein n=1 Tax=Paractinoplanes abujensis TaxID=882441 RepID=A0A7W7D0D9_9ACTN|nr:hypothetical protein [Actinoplanes abujensis]MBB4697684.1 hypothetical protein [Actinoplanes abujensis]GID19828.1 hypothetical protein Aab01nite_34180 [Actinoplanes abujensis]